MLGKNNNVWAVHSNLKEHYKAYKSGKCWAYIRLASLSLGATLILSSLGFTASAATTTAEETATHSVNDTGQTTTAGKQPQTVTLSTAKTISKQAQSTDSSTTDVTNKNDSAKAESTDTSTNSTTDVSTESSSEKLTSVTKADQNSSSTVPVSSNAVNQTDGDNQSDEKTSGTAAVKETASGHVDGSESSSAMNVQTAANKTAVVAKDVTTSTLKTAALAKNNTMDSTISKVATNKNVSVKSLLMRSVSLPVAAAVNLSSTKSTATLSADTTSVGYGSPTDATGKVTVTIDFTNVQKDDVLTIKLPHTSVLSFNSLEGLLGSQATFSRDDNSNPGYTVLTQKIQQDLGILQQRLTLTADNNYQKKATPMTDIGQTNPVLTVASNGNDLASLTFTQNIQPIVHLSNITRTHPNTNTSPVKVKTDYVYSFNVNESNGVGNVTGYEDYQSAQVNSADNYGTVITIPVPTGFTLNNQLTNSLNSFDDATTITQPEGSGGNILITVPKGSGKQGYQFAPGYQFVGSYNIAQPVTDEILRAAGNLKVVQKLNDTGTINLTAEGSVFSESLTGNNTVTLSSDRITPLVEGNSSGDTNSLILDNDPSNDPDYLASYGFTTNLTDVLESGINLKITVPDGIHFTGLTTPDDLVNSSQYLPNTTAYAYQLTYRDGTTENGIAAAGTKIVATNRTKQVASIVLTPNYLAAGAYTTKKAFTLEGTLLSTYSDGSLVQVGDKLNFTNEISYVANPEIKQTNVKTQTVGVPTAYVYGGVQFQKSTTPGENVAGSMNVWPTGNNTHTTYEVFEPTFYYVLPAASRYIGFSSGKKEDEAKAKISESFTDDGRTVIKIDFKGTGMYINTNLSGNIQVNLGNSIDALPGSYPYELYIYSPVTKLAQTEHVTNTSYTDGNADAIKFGSGNWIISVASTLTESVFAQGNQDFSPETTGRSDDRGSYTATFYTNIVSTFQNGTASNVVSLLNLPNINDGKSGYTFQLSGPITLPSHYTTTNGASGTAINGTVLYSPSLQTVTNGQLIDTTGYLTADKVTDWSAIRSIIIQLNNFGNLSATGRIKIAGKIVGEKTDFHHLAGTTGYLQTNMEINQQLSTSETSLSVTGTSTVTARLHYVDANGEDQYIALDDLSQSLKNNNDVLKDIYPKLITDFNATDQALIPKNYVQGSESYHYITTALTPTRIGDVATYDTDGEIIQYELVHQHDTSLTAQTTDTVHYDGLPESKLPKDKTVTVDWTGDRDQVTGVTVYKPVVSDSTNLTIKTLPVPGYDPDQAEVIFTPQQLTVSEADKLPQDEKVTVTYRAQQQSFTIKYVDDDDKESQVGDVIQETGLTDTPYNWTATAPDRYELAPNYEINYQGQFKPGIPNVVIHLIHHHTLSETTSYDNVTYTGLPAELLPADQQITVHWTVDKDDVLQTVTYLPKASKITYGIKSFDGYTVSPNAAEGSFTHTTSNKAPQDETQTVQYTAQQQSFTIKYVDDDDKGSQVGDVIQEAGLTDTPYNWTATAPDNYELKPGQILSGAGTFSVNMTDVVIHLVHHHTFAFMTSYDDVTYTGLPADKLPTKQHLTVNWTVDKDDVWKSVAYIPAARTVTYKIDHFAGYTVDPNEVSGVFTHITSHQFPTDQHQTITYTAQEQLFTIQYVDDDRNQAQVGVLIKKTGNTDTAYQWIAVAPSKYILATDQPLNGSGIFSPNMPNVVIHLVHQHSLSQVTSYDKVIYQGLPAWKKPANQQLAVNWTVNQDNVSNVTTYTPTATTIAYEIKFFDGYTVDPNPTQGYFIHRELTTLPQNETQTVSYTPQKQTFTIQYVDDDNHGVQVGLLTEKSGLTDTAFHWEAVAPTNYWLATNQKTDDAGRFEARMANVVIHLVHQHTFASMTSYDQVTYTGLPASKLPTKQRFAVNWIVDWDDIANTAIYMPTTTPVTYDIEHFAGYTVEPNMMTGTFTHTISTVTPHDEMQTVTYTAQSQSFMLQYVDDDEGGKPVGQVTTETGPMDAAYVWTAIAPDNYELATNQRTSGAGFFGVDMDNVVIHLVHRHALSQLISYDTLIYQGLPQEKLPNSQKFAVNWLVDQDEVLGTATYQTPSSKVSYSIKHFAGYTVDSAATAGTFIHAMTGVAPHDETQVVTYTAQVQFFTIQYVDDDENGQQVGDLKIESGNTDTPYHWNATSPANYALTAGYPTNGAGSFTVNMPNVVIHLRHQHDRSLTAKTTDTVTYTGLPASKYQPNQQLTINWTGDRDQVTGTVVYTPTTGGQTFNTPQIDGYRADQNEITFTPGKLTQKPMDLSQTVTYMPQIQFVNIKYVDDDCNGAQVGKITKQRGWTDAPYSWTAQTPKNYELVPGQATSGQGTFATDGNFIIIHVQHVHQLTTLTTVVRVDYTGLPASEAQSQRSRLINWQMNTDLVTRTQTYIPKPTTVVITTPTIAGYTADKKTVIFKADNTTMPPVDRQITVTYTAQPARMVVQYVDETLGKSMPELDTVLIGVTDQTGQYVVVIPQGYQLGKGQHATVNYHLTVTSAMQPLIVYLDHQFKAGTMQTVRTIHYTVMGAAQLAPQATVQTAWWNTSTDLVTHELTASAQTGYTAVLVPQIKGYVASQTSVPGISVAEIEAHGLDNQQVLVTYTALPKVSVQPKTPVKSETPAQPKAPVRLGQSTQPEAPVKPVGPQQGVQLEKAQPHRVTLIKPTSIPIRSHSVTQPSITTKRDTQHSTTELPQTNEQSRGNGALLGELLLSLLALVGVDRKKWHN